MICMICVICVIWVICVMCDLCDLCNLCDSDSVDACFIDTYLRQSIGLGSPQEQTSLETI